MSSESDDGVSIVACWNYRVGDLLWKRVAEPVVLPRCGIRDSGIPIRHATAVLARQHHRTRRIVAGDVVEAAPAACETRFDRRGAQRGGVEV